MSDLQIESSPSIQVEVEFDTSTDANSERASEAQKTNPIYPLTYKIYSCLYWSSVIFFVVMIFVDIAVSLKCLYFYMLSSVNNQSSTNGKAVLGYNIFVFCRSSLWIFLCAHAYKIRNNFIVINNIFFDFRFKLLLPRTLGVTLTCYIILLMIFGNYFIIMHTNLFIRGCETSTVEMCEILRTTTIMVYVNIGIMFLGVIFSCIILPFFNKIKTATNAIKILDLITIYDNTNGVSINEDCAICLELLSTDNVKLNCNHVYHKKCIDKWLATNVNCPVCRKVLISTEIKNFHNMLINM